MRSFSCSISFFFAWLPNYRNTWNVLSKRICHFILISLRSHCGSHSLAVFAYLHTLFLPHYTLVDVNSAQTCLLRHFKKSDIISSDFFSSSSRTLILQLKIIRKVKEKYEMSSSLSEMQIITMCSLGFAQHRWFVHFPSLHMAVSWYVVGFVREHKM